jgi:hypothetical protein
LNNLTWTDEKKFQALPGAKLGGHPRELIAALNRYRLDRSVGIR